MTGQTPTRLALGLAVVTATAGAIGWLAWQHAGLILSHYDAKAHLVVARRVFDNLTPGWQQIGAVWLPLPHLINLFPTQIDFFYRTGAFASAVSIACFGITGWAAARLVQRATGSDAGAVTAVLLLALNPNLVYLHATPMTEPLLIAASFLVVLWLDEWLSGSAGDSVPLKLRVVLFAAAWIRYEAWLVITAAFVLTFVVLIRRGESRRLTSLALARLAVWPALALVLFLVNSRITVGAWFVSSGFYVPDPTYEGLVGRSALAVWWGTHQMSGYVVEIAAVITALVIMRRATTPFVSLALFATAVLPFYAFVSGHPFRIRYMLPLVAACACFSGMGVGLLRSRFRLAVASTAAVALVVASVAEAPPWQGRGAPLVAESTWDLPASLERRTVTRCLAADYRGEKVLASMGSLAHYMQELSAEGFDIVDFIHEGNGTIWQVATTTPAALHAGWMLVEEEAEGGDVLAQRLRRDPAFATGMSRVCEGGGLALYRRHDSLADVNVPGQRPNLNPMVP